jgi:undecaprenyl-diphosphatase
MFFPSESLTIFFGILAFKGVVNINILIIVAYIGILVGDIIGYYIGKKVGEDFLRKHSKKLKIDEKKYNKMKQFLDNNLFKALFIGRSNGFTRWITPFLAGANGIKIDKFILVNMLTAAFWAPVFLLGGYYLGEAFEIYGKYFGITIIIITIIVFIFYKFYKYFDKKGYLKRNDIKLFLINIFGFCLFLKMLEDVLDLEKITKIDKWLHLHIVEIYTLFLNKVMVFITSLDNPLEITIISILIFLFLIFKKFYYKALFFIVSMMGASLLVEIIKNIVKRIRPEHYLIEVDGYSFPSGHATLSTVLSFSLYFILKDKLNKKILLLLCIIYPILISFSRVYLNVHYLSDVIAGIGLGLFWVSFLIILVFEK